MKYFVLIILCYSFINLNAQGLLNSPDYSEMERITIYKNQIKCIRIDTYVKVAPTFAEEYVAVSESQIKYYDTLGRIVKRGKVLLRDETTTSKDTFWVEYSYEANKRINFSQWKFKPNSSSESYYDNHFNLVKSILPEGKYILYKYNYENDHIINITGLSKADSNLNTQIDILDTVFTETYCYNENGLISKCIRENYINSNIFIANEYFYESAFSISKSTEKIINKNTGIIISLFETSYNYNENGLLFHVSVSNSLENIADKYYTYEFYN